MTRHLNKVPFLSFPFFTFLLGCQQYFNGDTLLGKSVDLTSKKLNNDQTFKFGRNHKDETCNLNGSYFHDYDGFQSFWRHVAEPGLFTLEMQGNHYSVEVTV